MQEHSTIPLGLCQCGCGQPTNLAGEANARYGHVKGVPVRFVRGHYAKVRPHTSLEAQFWARVEKTDGCWIWKGARVSGGYGKISIPGKKRILAHRLSYELAFGPIHDSMCVLHHCDNPPCTNPLHLFLGDRADNNTDKARKGRNFRPYGVKAFRHKLTAEQVLAIRASTSSNKQLSKEYGIATQNIWNIRAGRTWKHLLSN